MHVVIDGTAAINDIRAIHRYTRHLIAELTRIIGPDEISLLYLGYKPISKLPEAAKGPNIHEIKSIVPGRLLKLSWRLFRRPSTSFWMKRKIDIVHFPAGYPYVPTECRRVLTTLHGFLHYLMPEYTDPSERTAIRRITDLAVRNSHHLITVSEVNKREAMELWDLPEDRITSVPLGISPEFKVYETDRYRAGLLQKYTLPDKRYILYVGALERHKNIENIVRAYALLPESFRREWQLLLVGRQTEYLRDILRGRFARTVAAGISLINYIEPGSIDLAYLYNLADVFIFPTLYEGWASPPLEAIRCGTPAIVSDIPSLRESTGGTMLYVDPSSPEQIREAITKLSSDSALYQSLIANGTAFATRYTWEACARNTVDLYRRLVS